MAKDLENINAVKSTMEINLNELYIRDEVINLVRREIAERLVVMPFELKGKKLHVAMEDPSNRENIKLLRIITQKEIIPYKEDGENIKKSIVTYYENIKIGESKEEDVIEEVDYNLDGAPIIKLTEFIIKEAISRKSSDIHIEPYEDKIAVRYRIDGILLEFFKIPKDIYPSVCSRLKLISYMDISEKRKPQDGKFSLNVDGNKFDFRTSTLPTTYGEKIVIRILYKNSIYTDIEEIFDNEKELKLIEKILKNEKGMILVTGPTGSGKSTSLYSMLKKINDNKKNITTIEDPAEYSINGVNQVSVNENLKITFSSGLRCILRQDPDVIMVGEIRDEDTAKIAVRASITGHQVFSTLHTKDSLGAINRLVDMGVEKYILLDALVSVISQRLVKIVCPHCREEYFAGEVEKELLNTREEVKLYKGKGCEKCYNSGISKRKAIFEILYIDINIKNMINNNERKEKIIKYAEENFEFKSLFESCKELVLKGDTTIDELFKINSEI